MKVTHMVNQKSETFCGRKSDQTTTARESVTCKSCQREMAAVDAIDRFADELEANGTMDILRRF